jgi:hypothetical protein
MNDAGMLVLSYNGCEVIDAVWASIADADAVVMSSCAAFVGTPKLGGKAKGG